MSAKGICQKTIRLRSFLKNRKGMIALFLGVFVIIARDLRTIDTQGIIAINLYFVHHLNLYCVILDSEFFVVI